MEERDTAASGGARARLKWSVPLKPDDVHERDHRNAQADALSSQVGWEDFSQIAKLGPVKTQGVEDDVNE